MRHLHSTALVVATLVAVSALLGANSISPVYDYPHWDDANLKYHIRSILLEELADTPEIALRRVNGTEQNPQPVEPNEVVGLWYGQAWGKRIDGTYGYDTGRGSPYYGRQAQFQIRAIGQQTGYSRAGQWEISTTPVGSTVSRIRTYGTSDGRFVHLGPGAFEAFRATGQAEETVNALGPDNPRWGRAYATFYARRSDLYGPAAAFCFAAASAVKR